MKTGSGQRLNSTPWNHAYQKTATGSTRAMLHWVREEVASRIRRSRAALGARTGRPGREAEMWSVRFTCSSSRRGAFLGGNSTLRRASKMSQWCRSPCWRPSGSKAAQRGRSCRSQAHGRTRRHTKRAPSCRSCQARCERWTLALARRSLRSANAWETSIRGRCGWG